MLSAFISTDTTQKGWKLYAQRLKNSAHRHKTTDRGEVRTPDELPLSTTPLPGLCVPSPWSCRRVPSSHPRPTAPSLELFLVRYGFPALSCPSLFWEQSSDLCKVFPAGGKPLLLLPSTRGDPGSPPGFHGVAAEPGVSSYTCCPISSVQAQTLTVMPRGRTFPFHPRFYVLQQF